MGGFDNWSIFSMDEIPFVIIALLVAFTVHEFSHAYVAYKFGDSTAKNAGRLTLNPTAHLDLLGTVLIFIAGFGYAKPVPVNYFNLTNKRLGGVLISLAGPLSNLLIATFSMGIWYGLLKFNLLASLGDTAYSFVYHLFDEMIFLNIVLFIFNLFPFPPLDGYGVIEDLAPDSIRPRLVEFEKYGGFIFLILVITPLGDYVFPPMFNTIRPFIYESLDKLFVLIYNF